MASETLRNPAVERQGGDHSRVPHHRSGVGEEELAVAVQNAQAPGRERQQPGAGKENLNDADGQFPLAALKPRSDGVDQERRGQHAKQNQNRRGERQNGADRARHAACFLLVALRQQAAVNRNERRREDPLSKQVLQKVGDAERGAEGVGHIRKSEIVGEHALPHEAHQAAEQNAGAHQERMAAGAFGTLSWFHRSSFSSTAEATSSVELVPPRSGVRTLPSASTAATASSTSRAASLICR